MAVTRATDLGVAKNSDVAEMVAAALFDTVKALPASTGVEKTVVRQLTKHAHELLELHSLKADEVLPSGAAKPDNGWQPAEHES